MSDKIIEDIYSKLSSKLWGRIIIAVSLLLIVLFFAWNSLPESAKESFFMRENVNAGVFETGKSLGANFVWKKLYSLEHNCDKISTLSMYINEEISEHKKLFENINDGSSGIEFQRGYEKGALETYKQFTKNCPGECGTVGTLAGELSGGLFCDISKHIGRTAKFFGYNELPKLPCGKEYRISCEKSFKATAEKLCPAYATGDLYEHYFSGFHGGVCSYNSDMF